MAKVVYEIGPKFLRFLAFLQVLANYRLLFQPLPKSKQCQMARNNDFTKVWSVHENVYPSLFFFTHSFSHSGTHLHSLIHTQAHPCVHAHTLIHTRPRAHKQPTKAFTKKLSNKKHQRMTFEKKARNFVKSLTHRPLFGYYIRFLSM